jgi:ribosomal protein S14
MKFLVLRNFLKVKKYIMYEKLYLVLKYIYYNTKIPLKVRFKALLLLSKHKVTLVNLRRRCSITKRGKGMVRFFSLSRILSREKARSNNLPFIQKYSW